LARYQRWGTTFAGRTIGSPGLQPNAAAILGALVAFRAIYACMPQNIPL